MADVRKGSVGLLAVTALCLFCGCASLHINKTDSTCMKVSKCFCRVPVAVLTIGGSEMWHQRERVMRSWVGASESDLALASGPPSQVLDDGKGGRILVYAETRTYVSKGRSTTNSYGQGTANVYGNTMYLDGQTRSETTYTPPHVHQWQVYRNFRVDANGIITDYAWRGF